MYIFSIRYGKLEGIKEMAKLLKQRAERLKPMIQEWVKKRNKDDYAKEERI